MRAGWVNFIRCIPIFHGKGGDNGAMSGPDMALLVSFLQVFQQHV